MTHTSKPIVFFGTDEFSAISLRELISKGFTIAAVVTKPDSRKGRGRKLETSPIKKIAETHNIPIWQPLRMDAIAEHVKKLDDPIGVLVSYGKIIPASIISLFNPGIINLHPSLLPRYRGPSPVESAILHGDTETGVTIMQLTPAMDAGPIYSQVVVPLLDIETAPELETQLGELGAQELSVVLPKIISGVLQPTEQDSSVATYCQLLTKEDGVLKSEKLTADQAERQVRAFIAFPKTRVTLAEHQIVITKAHVETTTDSAVAVQCSDGRFLVIDELIGPSGRSMSAQAFANGYVK